MSEEIELLTGELDALEAEIREQVLGLVLVVGEKFSAQLVGMGRRLAGFLAADVGRLVVAGPDCPVTDYDAVAELASDLASLSREKEKLMIVEIRALTDLVYDERLVERYFRSPPPPVPRQIGKPTQAKCQPYSIKRKVLPCNRR